MIGVSAVPSPVLSLAINRVVFLRSEKHVVGVDAERRVALVADAHSCWHFALVSNIERPVSQHILPMAA